MKIAGLLFVLLLSLASAVEPRQLLQEGLFEEEANRDLDKASAAYESLIASFDKERQYAATALFRLAEIRAKQNRKEDAIALFQRVLTEFSTNDPLARLSHERIAALGGDTPKLPGGDPSISDKERQELARLQDLVKNSPDLLNSVDKNVTTLGQAARAGWLKAAAFLLDHGADPNSPRAGFPPIHLATTDGRKVMVELLIARGADVNARDAQNRTPLQIAAEFSRLEVARLLLDHGTKVDAVALEGLTNQTPLQHACANGNIPMVRLLLEKNADVNVVSKTNESISLLGGTPLTAAVRIKNLELVTLLLDRGAKIDIEGELPTSSALAYAVIGKSLPIVQKLIERGAKLANPWLVYQAAGAEEPEILRLLISKGADVNAQLYKESGTTALHEFVHRSLEVTKLLLELGASPKVVDAQKIRLCTAPCPHTHIHPLLNQLTHFHSKWPNCS